MPRPRRYNEDALLEAVMQRFWAQGYGQTSVDDLVKVTGVNRASLYNAYPDKRALFLAALRHYLVGVTADSLRRLHEGEPVAAIRAFFDRLVDGQSRGCLLTNSAVELGVDDPEVSELLHQAFGRVEAALAERLREAQVRGHLDESVAPRSLARQLLVLIQGLRVMARSGMPRPVLRDAVDSALVGLR